MVPALQQKLAHQRIKLCLNAPAAPYFGGVWERKFIQWRWRSIRVLDHKRFLKMCYSPCSSPVKAILNSKPLDYVSADIANLDPVTPSSLLLGWSDGSLPLVVYSRTEILSLCRWRHSQVLSDQFWSRCIREYLLCLQARQKWQSSPSVLQDNAVIMLVDPQLSQARWPIGCTLRTNINDMNDQLGWLKVDDRLKIWLISFVKEFACLYRLRSDINPTRHGTPNKNTILKAKTNFCQRKVLYRAVVDGDSLPGHISKTETKAILKIQATFNCKAFSVLEYIFCISKVFLESNLLFWFGFF